MRALAQLASLAASAPDRRTGRAPTGHARVPARARAPKKWARIVAPASALLAASPHAPASRGRHRIAARAGDGSGDGRATKTTPATTVRFPEGAFETAPTRVAESDADGDNPPADRRSGSPFFSRKTFFARLAETRLSTDASRFPLPHLAYVNTAERSRCIARHAFGRESVRASASPNTSYYETEDGPGVDERLRLLREEEEKNSSGGSRARFAPRFETEKERLAFFGAIALNVLLGSVYCWSCFLVPLEQALGVKRGVLSWVFSVTTVAFTVAVAKLGPALCSRLPPRRVAAAAAATAGCGMLLAAQSATFVSVTPLFLGYGLMFGGAAGVGYALSLQISAAAPFGEGLSVGVVTSARAAGAFLFAPVVRYLLDVTDVGGAMRAMGVLMLLCAFPLHATLSAGGRYDAPLAKPRRLKGVALSDAEIARDAQLKPAMVTLWCSLCLGVSAGLMVISHAATLLYSHGASIGVATAGVSVVSFCTSLGRVAGGYLCDREKWGPAKVLRTAPLLAAPALAWASLAANSVPAAQCALALASLTYGAVGTAVPTEVRRRVGAGNFARAYGKVYTAWGVAGLAAPAAAGVLYDAAGNYVAALAAATGLCLLAALAAAMLKPGRSHEEWRQTIREADAS